MYALVDCNNFYASCERIFRPDLKGKPIVVLSNNDGCVIARSSEAKALGIPMGALAFQYQKMFDKYQVQVFSSNFALYGDMSARVMHLLSEAAPEIEIYSIDEAFLKFESCDFLDLESYGKILRNTILKSTGISVSIGFAKSKTLAKVANRIAKKYAKHTQGVYVIDTDTKKIKALKWLDIGDVWGIGRRYAKRLQKMGIYKAFDFIQLPEQWIQKNMSIIGLRMKKELDGQAVLGIEKMNNKKSIATTRSFSKNYTQYEEVKERVTTFAVTCAEKLRKQKTCCNSLVVFIHANPHRKDLLYYSKNIRIRLPFATNSAIELSAFAVKALRLIFKEGIAYKKAGVIVMDICPENNRQITLFENTNDKHQILMQTMDAINKNIGQQKLRLASQSLGRTWKMRQERLSNRYTTRLDEIINVRVE